MSQTTLALFESAAPAAPEATVASNDCMPDAWIVDPARLSFHNYRDRLIWGPPDTSKTRPCINQALARRSFKYAVEQRQNPYLNGEDADYGTWDSVLDIGRSYLVGAAVPMHEFLRVHTSPLNDWQRLAYAWCLANPSLLLVLTSARLIYHVCKRGEYVEIGLPHHGHGGEKYWVCRDGKAKVLINLD